MKAEIDKKMFPCRMTTESLGMFYKFYPAKTLIDIKAIFWAFSETASSSSLKIHRGMSIKTSHDAMETWMISSVNF